MFLAILHKDACLAYYDPCKIVYNAFECMEEKCTCTSIKLCTSIPLRSGIVAYIKTVKAFREGNNVAKYKEIEILLRLFGVRQIKTVTNTLNSYCKESYYAITVAHIDAELTEGKINSISRIIAREFSNAGCDLINQNDLTNYIHGCKIIEALLPMLSRYCNDIMLLGISGSSDVFFS